MSGTIWLITEDENDYKVVRAILKKLNLSIQVQWRSPSGKTPGLSRLAAEIKQLIAQAQKLRSGNDCIVVLHDDDQHRAPKRDNYDKVRDICNAYGVTLIVAKDELEAWFLSDSGICGWLGEPVKTWNGDSWPSNHLRSVMHSRYKMKYPRDLDKLLVHMKADGINQSLKAALAILHEAPCVKPEG